MMRIERIIWYNIILPHASIMHHWYVTPEKYICSADFLSAIKNVSILNNQDCNHQDGLIFVLKEFYLWRRKFKDINKIRCKLSIEMSTAAAGSRIKCWSRVITYPSAGCVGIDREPDDSFSETARNCKIKLLLEGRRILSKLVRAAAGKISFFPTHQRQ